MKVDDARIPTEASGKTLPGKRPNSGSFYKILERARENDRARKGQEREPLSLSDDAPSAFALPTLMPPDQNQAAMVSQASEEISNEAIGIQALVDEILVVAQPNGQHDVELQFNSKTLDGLNVKITQGQDQISIRFSTTSASVSDLISRNLDQLSDALEHKGLQLAPIQVEFHPTQTNFESTGTGARDRRSGQQNERQRQQRHQKK
jgi:flagellar hook-length control protein FliK